MYQVHVISPVSTIGCSSYSNITVSGKVRYSSLSSTHFTPGFVWFFFYMVPQMHLESNRQTVHEKRAPSICGSGQVLQACWGLIQVQPTPRANFPIKKRRRRKMLMFLLWDIISSLLVQIRASNPRLFSRKSDRSLMLLLTFFDVVRYHQ